MGILNVMPDSFSDGGQYFDRDRAIARGKEMEGAEIAIRVVCTQFFGWCVHGDSGGMHTLSRNGQDTEDTGDICMSRRP